MKCFDIETRDYIRGQLQLYTNIGEIYRGKIININIRDHSCFMELSWMVVKKNISAFSQIREEKWVLVPIPVRGFHLIQIDPALNMLDKKNDQFKIIGESGEICILYLPCDKENLVRLPNGDFISKYEFDR